MGKSIFISYRVQDTSGETGRLVDTLKRYYSSDQLFIDIEKIEPGLDFTQVINKYLEKCEVLLMVIGPHWVGSDVNGNPRIVKDDDWVRIEVATALKRNIRIIPLLVDGADFPDISQLPEDIAYITRLQAHEISNRRWEYDTKQLVNYLNKIGIVANKVDINPKVEKKFPLATIAKVGIGVLIGIVFIIVLAFWIDGFEENNAAAETNFNQISNIGVEDDYYSDQVADVNNIPSNNTNSSTKDILPVTNKARLNVTGVWKEIYDEPATLEIFQTGNDLSVTVFSNYGGAVGTGKGVIDGNSINIQIENYYTYVRHIISVQLVQGGNQLKGTITASNDGQSVSHPYILNKCDQCSEKY